MECPAPPGAPNLHDELWRGVNPYNLKFGAVASVALGVLTALATSRGWLPEVWQKPPSVLAVTTSLLLFILLTLTHTAAHGFVGWVLELGLKAQCRGNLDLATRLLALAEKPGMDHYDPHGVALAALQECRRQRSTRVPGEDREK